MKERRRERINEVIRRVVSSAIVTEVKDPRVGFVTVTRVEVADDLREARVYCSVLGQKPRQRAAVEALNRMKGFLQKDLGPALQTRNTPQLVFELDEATEKAFRMDALIRTARASDADGGTTSPPEKPGGPPPPELADGLGGGTAPGDLSADLEEDDRDDASPEQDEDGRGRQG